MVEQFVLAPPQTDDELWDYVAGVLGIELPRVAVCPDHVSPFQAYADAYFARYPIIVWKASRGLAGKSFTLATLCIQELIDFGAMVKVLGGSGAQSQNVNRYTKDLWAWPHAPRSLLVDEPGKFETKLTNGGNLGVLLASQRSARGPHPQRLRMDEVDDMDIEIFDAAMGQTMEAKGVAPQTVISSTHQYPNGTMSEVLKRAHAKGWPVYSWCWRETIKPHGWLNPSEVTRKKSEVTDYMWHVEYELAEPSAEGRVFSPEHVDVAFDPLLGVANGDVNEYLEFEPPEPDGIYSTGIDWGRKAHWTVIVTYRTDVMPWRLVAFERLGRENWEPILKRANWRIDRYPGAAAHDETGIGDPLGQLGHVQAQAINFGNSMLRQAVLIQYQVAFQAGQIVNPDVTFMRNEHRYCLRKDLAGAGHPPDTFIAAALAWHMRDRVMLSLSPESGGRRNAFDPEWLNNQGPSIVPVTRVDWSRPQW